MAIEKKHYKIKVYIAIFLVAILVIATAAIVYATQISLSRVDSVRSVHVGDTFTYNTNGRLNFI